jgi:hypothetical protein
MELVTFINQIGTHPLDVVGAVVALGGLFLLIGPELINQYRQI